MKSRNFCWTKNNPGDWKPKVEETEYTIYGEEIAPTTGTLHYQGFSQFKQPISIKNASKKLGDCHCEIMRGTCSQAREYCMKENKYVEYGAFSPGQGSRREIAGAIVLLREAKGDINVVPDELMIKYHHGFDIVAKRYQPKRDWEMEVFVFWGPPGSGKSRLAHAMCPKAYWKPAGNWKWWDGYNGETCVIIDDFQDQDWPRDYILRLLDRYPMTVEIKGGSTQFRARSVIITTNQNGKVEWDPALRRRITEWHEFRPEVAEGNNEPQPT